MLLAGIFEIRCHLMLINIAVLSYKCVFLLELLWCVLANSVGLLGESAHPYVRVKGLPVHHKFKHVTLLHNKIITPTYIPLHPSP